MRFKYALLALNVYNVKYSNVVNVETSEWTSAKSTSTSSPAALPCLISCLIETFSNSLRNIETSGTCGALRLKGVSVIHLFGGMGQNPHIRLVLLALVLHGALPQRVFAAEDAGPMVEMVVSEDALTGLLAALSPFEQNLSQGVALGLKRISRGSRSSHQ